MRFIFTLMLISALAFLTACQSAAAPKSIEKIEKSEAPVAPAPQTGDDHAGHDHGEEAPRITLAEAKKDFDTGEAVFIDTRSSSSYDNERISGAVNIPKAEFEGKYQSLPKDKKLIVYCS